MVTFFSFKIQFCSHFFYFFTGGLEAQPGPGRAFGVAGRPAGFAGRAKPAPGPNSDSSYAHLRQRLRERQDRSAEPEDGVVVAQKRRRRR